MYCVHIYIYFFFLLCLSVFIVQTVQCTSASREPTRNIGTNFFNKIGIIERSEKSKVKNNMLGKNYTADHSSLNFIQGIDTYNIML